MKLKSKNAFTLIELVVTMAIIVMMAVIALPAFLRYEEKAEYISKVDEVKEAIFQAGVSAQNAEQNVTKIIVKAEVIDNQPDELTVYKNAESDGNIIKKVTIPERIVLTNTNTANISYILFEMDTKRYCQKNSISPMPTCGPNNTINFLQLQSIPQSALNKTIKIYGNTFRVEAE